MSMQGDIYFADKKQLIYFLLHHIVPSIQNFKHCIIWIYFHNYP